MSDSVTYNDTITSGIGAFSQAPQWLSTDRPNPPPTGGMFGYATDTDQWEWWDGSAWVHFATLEDLSNAVVTANGTDGQSNTLANWFRGIAKDSSNTQFLGSDASVQFATDNTPLAVEYWTAQGGISNAGAVLHASGDGADISGSISAKGTGGVYFGNGSGGILNVIDPGGIPTRQMTITSGVSARPKLAATSGGVQIESADQSTTIITEAGQTVAEFGTTGTIGTSIAWCKFEAGTSSNLARFLATGTDGSGNTGFFIQARGAGGITLANGSGNHIVTANSSANTAAGNLSVRAASTAQPVLLQTSGSHNVAIGGVNGSMAAIATTATVGYVGIPTCAGPPTGVPVGGAAGCAYLVFDTTNEKLYRYFGGAWKSSAAFT